MNKNVRCSIGEILNLLKEKYLKEGEEALCADSDWHIYIPDEELTLNSLCCVTAPPEFDEETEEEIVPRFARDSGMYGSILPEILQDVIISALEQKQNVTDRELLQALNYYLDNDAFLEF